jgi:hypothetical protein
MVSDNQSISLRTGIGAGIRHYVIKNMIKHGEYIITDPKW